MSPRRLFSLGSVALLSALRASVAVLAYTGAAAAAQDVSVGVASFPCDRASTQFKLSGAWNFADAWEAQLAYFRAGSYRGGDPIPLGGEFGGIFRVDGVGLSAGYRWSFAPGWRATARLGATSMRTRFEYANALAGNVSKTTLQPFGGVSVGYAITPALRIGVDYDVTRFKVYRTQGSLRMLGVATQFSF